MDRKRVEKTVNRYVGKPLAKLIYGTVVACSFCACWSCRGAVWLSRQLSSLRTRTAA